MGSRVGISFELDQGERVLLESPTFCPVEFYEQGDLLESLLGEGARGRVICKPYLTSRRLLLWLLLEPKRGEPRDLWYAVPYGNIVTMQPGRHGPVEKRRKGLEVEFTLPERGGVVAGIRGEPAWRGWYGRAFGEKRTRLWLYVPDYLIWNLTISRIKKETP